MRWHHLTRNWRTGRTRTVIPVKQEFLEPTVIPTSSTIRASVMKKQQNTKSYDKNEKPLPPLVVRDSIRGKISSQSSPLWTKGNGVRKETDRSYVIRADGREYRRNCCHIRKTRELTTPKSSVPDSMLAIPADPVTPSPQTLKRTPPAQQSESSADPGSTKCQKIVKTSQTKLKVQRLCSVEVALRTFSLSAQCLIVSSPVTVGCSVMFKKDPESAITCYVIIEWSIIRICCNSMERSTSSSSI